MELFRKMHANINIFLVNPDGLPLIFSQEIC